jgi:hypothetical protein
MKFRLAIISAFWLFGLLLVGGSLTGMVVSQSCCFGEECAPENRCVIETQSPAPADTSIIGLLIIIAAVGVLIAELHYARHKEEKAKERKSRTYRVV